MYAEPCQKAKMNLSSKNLSLKKDWQQSSWYIVWKSIVYTNILIINKTRNFHMTLEYKIIL